MDANETWTPTHDLALLYIALAYGTDHQLSDKELSLITSTLDEWDTLSLGTDVKNVVMEAAAIFLETDAREEVQRSIDHLGEELSTDQRRRALNDVIRIAEADGVLLEREQGLIRTVADAWSLKRLSQELMADTDAVVQRHGEDWSVIHELAYIYLVIAHGADNDLSTEEVEVILERLQEWQPDLTEEDARDVVRGALQVYAKKHDEEIIRESMTTLKRALPDVQRLAVLDDLHCIARADGDLTDNEREIITSVARAWDVNVRLNGRC